MRAKQSFFSRFFPTPKFIRLGTVGLNFSDASVRMMELQQTPNGILPKRYFEAPLPEGLVVGGKIVEEQAFAEFLKAFRKKHSFRFAYVSISEPQIYSFATAIDRINARDIDDAIEFVLEDYIPLKLSESVFDYEIIGATDSSIIVQVIAMSSSTATTLARVLDAAGIVPMGFELEGEALARAIIPRTATGSSMIVDFGARRTGLVIISSGVVVYSATIDFGGNDITEQIAKALSVSTAQAEELKRSIGLSSPTDSRELFEALTVSLNVLKEEINRRFIYWHEKRQFPELLAMIDRVYVTGGGSNLPGLAEYLRSALRLSVEIANPWQACVSFDTAIPPLTQMESESYATAIGLALTDLISTKK
jgi:type IV pilus assembly protein PilM